MAVPKKRTSKSRKGMRRSHDALKFKAAVHICPSCGELKLYHHICDACGTYRGEQVIADAE
ncbi:MAG: 50S ribosomal protein L32 [Myxococcota bacterium]|jgi:large subunit ribosomal protein L32